MRGGFCYRQGCRAMPVPYVFDNPLFFFPLWRPTDRKNTKNLTFSNKTIKNHKKPCVSRENQKKSATRR